MGPKSIYKLEECLHLDNTSNLFDLNYDFFLSDFILLFEKFTKFLYAIYPKLSLSGPWLRNFQLDFSQVLKP
jgi:hypothetical protein